MDLMLNNNKAVKFLKEEYQLNQHDWYAQIEGFVLPPLSLDFSSSLTKHIKDFGQETNKEEIVKSPYPSHTVSLNLGSYTLWDWGKSTASLRENYYTKKQNDIFFKQAILDAKVNLITSYFELRQSFDDFTENWFFFHLQYLMYSIYKEKDRAGVSIDQDLDELELNLVKAALETKAMITSFKSQQSSFALLIGMEGSGTNYEPKDEIPFIPLKMSRKNVMEKFEKLSPELKLANYQLQLAEIRYNEARKSLLPLPVVTFDGLNLTLYENVPGDELGRERYWEENGALKMSVSATISIPLIGTEGFFNYRRIRRELFEVRKARNEFETATRKARQDIINLYTNIKDNEIRVKLAKKARNKGFEMMQETYQEVASSKLTQEEMIDLATGIKEALSNYRSAACDHLSGRLELAKMLIIESLPGKRSKKYKVIP